MGHLIHFLWSKKTGIILLGALGISFGILLATFTEKQYEAKLTFIVDQAGSSKRLGALSGIASSFGFGGLGGDGGLYENQVNLMNFLKSRSIIERSLLQRIPETSQTFAERFIKVYEWDEDFKNENSLKSVHFLPEQDREEFSISKDSVLFEIFNNILENNRLEISLPDEEGNIISIKCSFKDDTLSNYFPSVLLDQVSTSYVNAKTKLAKENVRILQRQADSVRSELNQSLYSSAQQTDEVFGLNPAFNVKRVPANKEQIDVRASTVLLEELIKNLELAKVQLKDETPLIEVIDEPRFPLEEIRASKLKYGILSGIIISVVYMGFLLVRKFLNRIKREAIILNK